MPLVAPRIVSGIGGLISMMVSGCVLLSLVIGNSFRIAPAARLHRLFFAIVSVGMLQGLFDFVRTTKLEVQSQGLCIVYMSTRIFLENLAPLLVLAFSLKLAHVMTWGQRWTSREEENRSDDLSQFTSIAEENCRQGHTLIEVVTVVTAIVLSAVWPLLGAALKEFSIDQENWCEISAQWFRIGSLIPKAIAWGVALSISIGIAVRQECSHKTLDQGEESGKKQRDKSLSRNVWTWFVFAVVNVSLRIPTLVAEIFNLISSSQVSGDPNSASLLVTVFLPAFAGLSSLLAFGLFGNLQEGCMNLFVSIRERVCSKQSRVSDLEVPLVDASIEPQYFPIVRQEVLNQSETYIEEEIQPRLTTRTNGGERQGRRKHNVRRTKTIGTAGRKKRIRHRRPMLIEPIGETSHYTF